MALTTETAQEGDTVKMKQISVTWQKTFEATFLVPEDMDEKTIRHLMEDTAYNIDSEGWGVEWVAQFECHRYPPVLVYGTAEPVWPSVRWNEVCGEWLREHQPGWPAGSGGHADAIERGEHRREEEK